MFTGINIFWARLKLGLARAAGRGFNKVSSEKGGPKTQILHFSPQNAPQCTKK